MQIILKRGLIGVATVCKQQAYFQDAFRIKVLHLVMPVLNVC
jgi:hypothetical protein